MNELLINLPEEVQMEVRETLKAFRRVEVTFYGGNYHVETGSYLLAKYPDDFKVVGSFTDQEIFTDAERTLNYINEFRDFPIWYQGRRDYKWLKSFGYKTEITADDLKSLNQN